MTWLPVPRDFRAALQAARQLADPLQRLEALAALSRHQLDFVQTIQLDRAVDQAGGEAQARLAQVRLAILSSCTVDHLAPAVRVAGLRKGLAISVHTGAYGQFRQELLDPASAVYAFRPGAVLLALAAGEAIANVPLTATVAEADAALDRSLDDLRRLWERARKALEATVIQQTFLDLTPPLFGSFDRLVPGVPGRLVARLNDRLADAAAREGVLLLDLAGECARDGRDAWFDVARWLQAKQEIAPAAAPAYGELTARILAAQRGLAKKCLVLDLDNTLWGGVIGDDGLEGIVLGPGSAAGEAHVALQRYARQLADRGVILAVCSKNDPATARAVFDQHPEMILRRTDFAAFVANWNDKTQNLQAIATELNIGLDALVFVDDNPAERARIRQALPMVAVPELPADVGNYVACLAAAGYFEAVAFTADDTVRTGQYRANAARESLRESAQSMGDFLADLDMALESGPFAAVDLPRVTQLINKTNQFNPTTRRYTAEQVTGLVTAPDTLTFQFRLADRFGDNGLVAAMILRPVPGQPGTLDLDTWVMSCRVFGRELEFEAMNIAVEAARRRGALAISADYIPTARNGVVSEVYAQLGFARATDTTLAHGASRWRLALDDYSPRVTHIARKAG